MLPEDEHWMACALRHGRRMQGRTWPNPSVGCLLISDGRLVGRGVTQPGGRPHAETRAIDEAGQQARSSTAYVTLEPCAHEGQSGSCARRLLEAGVGRVVSAVQDPDPRVGGCGHAMLRAKGVEVTTGCGSAEAGRDHRGFFYRVLLERPMITLKLASSFDGKVATRTGHSKWITGRHSRRLVHAMRSQHDAIMIGSGTAHADDPELTCRIEGGSGNPVRVVLDSSLTLRTDCKLARTIGDAPLWLCHQSGADRRKIGKWNKSGARSIACKTHRNGRLDLEDVLTKLARHGLTRILCEGGSRLAASLIAEDLVDDIVGFTAGLVLGAEALSAVGNLDCSEVSDGRRYLLDLVDYVGHDTISHWTRPLDLGLYQSR